MVELEEKDFSTVETNKQILFIELDTRDLNLIIVTARVPETNLRVVHNERQCSEHMYISRERSRERERERERERGYYILTRF